MAEEEKSGGIGTALKKKEFGVPVWSIGLVLAAGFILFMIIRNRRNAATADTADTSGGADPNAIVDAQTDTADSIDPNTGVPYSQSPSYPVGLTAQGTPAPQTNVQWSRLAFDEIVALGDDPTLVTNALSKYLSGSTLSAAEQAVVNQALQAFGAPPEGLIPVSVSTPAPVVTPTQPTGTVASAGLKAPSGFVITAETRSSSTVVFNPVAGAASYNVYKGSTVVASGARPPIIISNLQPGTKSTFTVAAVSATGTVGPKSGPFSATTKK